MNLKVSKEFKKRLKILAAEENCLMIEIMEKALEIYSAKQIYERQSKTRTIKKT
jgi:predicted transcriptional regulator